MANDDLRAQINAHPSYFRDLPRSPATVEFFAILVPLTLVSLTACPQINSPGVAAQKGAWVREPLSSTAWVLPVMGARHKPLFVHWPGDVLIDDRPRNCATGEEAGGMPILHSNRDSRRSRDQVARLKQRGPCPGTAPQQLVVCAAENEHAE